MAKKGPFIQSSWLGIEYMKSRHSGKYRLSKDSRVSANAFSIASALGREFRHLFAPVLPFPKSKLMQTTFVGAIKKWIIYKKECGVLSPTDLLYVNGFQFNPSSSFCDRLHVPLQVGLQQPGTLVLQIPAIVPVVHVGAPAYTKMVQWKMMAACVGLKNQVAIDVCSAALTMPYNDLPIASQSVILPLTMPANSLSLVVAALTYTEYKNAKERVSTDKMWLPCGIVGGWVKE